MVIRYLKAISFAWHTESLKENVYRLIEDIAEISRDSLEKGKNITEAQKKKTLEMIASGEMLLPAQKEKLKRIFK